HIMAEIAEASKEQSAGIAQVNQAVANMDEVTQQNAALVEEAAAAAESLQEQAGQLAELVSVFKLKNGASNVKTVAKSPAKAITQPKFKPISKPTIKNEDEEWAEF
ncbi:MAG: methyl-accepting chemotaxis protein, partial [Deefgea sp.]